jgi:hypothetical protein
MPHVQLNTMSYCRETLTRHEKEHGESRGLKTFVALHAIGIVRSVTRSSEAKTINHRTTAYTSLHSRFISRRSHLTTNDRETKRA